MPYKKKVNILHPHDENENHAVSYQVNTFYLGILAVLLMQQSCGLITSSNVRREIHRKNLEAGTARVEPSKPEIRELLNLVRPRQALATIA